MESFKEMYTKTGAIKDVKAVHKTSWDKKNRTKFAPGDLVRVSKHIFPGTGESERTTARRGQIGIIMGVTCTSDGSIRGRSSGYCDRMYTRYFVAFNDGKVLGLHSHNLQLDDTGREPSPMQQMKRNKLKRMFDEHRPKFQPKDYPHNQT